MKPRIDRARQKLKVFDYLVKNRSGVTEKCLCKGCGAVLWSMVPMEHGQWSEKKGNQTFVYQPVIAATTAEYAVVEIEMSDGSKHQTPLCQRCASDMSLDMDAVFAADADALIRGGAKAAAFDKRIPVKARKL